MENQTKQKKVVVIGGGTGSYVVLSGLKAYDLKIVAVTTVGDDGGSTGRLRDEFGFLPAGDMRQCIAALSEENGYLRDLLLYRFDKGEKGLRGHNLGNLIITALEDLTGSESRALMTMGKIFSLKGRVLPVSLEMAKIGAKYSTGKRIISEHLIEENVLRPGEKIEKLFTKPEIFINPSLKRELKDADLIVFGPGDLYNSTIANLIVSGVPESLVKSKAKIVQIMNLMTLASQTSGMTMSDHVAELEKYLTRKVDYILINKREISEDIIENYEKSGESPIFDDLGKDKRVIRRDLMSLRTVQKNSSDTLKRSLIRHSSTKIARALMSIL